MSLVEESCEALITLGPGEKIKCGEPASETLSEKLKIVDDMDWHVCFKHYCQFEAEEPLWFLYMRNLIVRVRKSSFPILFPAEFDVHNFHIGSQ
jgi:hypothetical protein